MESGEIERELEELENRVERLRSLYEQYFMGIEKMEPQIPRKDVDRRIWILRREQIRNTGLRFKFQMIVQRYNTFQQYWARVAREIENGTYRRDVMRAAARFGEKDALTVLGKKRADKYRNLIENQKKLREGGRKAVAEALGDDAPADAARVPAPEPSGPGWGDITEVMDPNEVPVPESIREEVEAESSPSPPRRPPPPPPTAPAAPLGGLRWSLASPRAPAATPSEPTVTEAIPSSAKTPAAAAPPRRRVAELAAEMRAKKSDPTEAGVGGLDLDFDADMTLPGPGPAPPKRRRSSKSMKAVRPEPGQAVAPNPPPVAAPQPRPPPAPPQRPAPSASAARPPVPAPSEPTAPNRPPPPPITKPLGMPRPIAAPTIREGQGDGPWDEATQLSTRRKLAAAADAAPPTAPPAAAPPPAPKPPDAGAASPARPAVPPVRTPARPVPAARPSEPTAAEPAAKRTPQDLSDQRIRQIYSKYVETKRNANESTAGVTYERLAESLRAQADKLRSSHPTKSVDYEVVTKDGKTMLKPILR